MDKKPTYALRDFFGPVILGPNNLLIIGPRIALAILSAFVIISNPWEEITFAARGGLDMRAGL